MADAFKESNTITFRQNVVFYTGFSIIADQAFNIGSASTTNSFLNSYNTFRPYGGISGYLRSGEVGGTGFTNIIVSGTGYFNSGIVIPYYTPTGTSVHPGISGQIAWNTGYFFVCTGTNKWARVALESF